MSIKASVFEKTDQDTSRFNGSRFNPRGSHGDAEGIGGLLSEQVIEKSRKSAPGYTAKHNPRTKLKSINVVSQQSRAFKSDVTIDKL